MPDLICIGMEEWDEVWRRTQNLMVRLARRHPDWRILFVSSHLDLPHQCRRLAFRTLWRKVRARSRERVEGLPNLFVTQPMDWIPETLPGGRRMNEMLIRGQIRRAVRRAQLRCPVLWIKPYYAAHLVGALHESATIYDVGDDWSAMYPAQSAAADRTRRQDEWLTRQADAVSVVSPALLKAKNLLRQDVREIPNGVDFERYAPIARHQVPPEAATEHWPRPIIGYTGTMHAARLDIDLILHIARSYPHGTVALVGPDYLPPELRQRLQSEPAVKFVPAVPHERLHEMLAAFDACIVPSLRNSFTESQNPLKLFEYLAAGLPIVSTRISGFRDFPDLVYLADEPEAFVAALHQALAEPAAKRLERSERARAHSWEERVGRVERMIADVSAAKSHPSCS